MASETSGSGICISRLIFVPALISLGITVLRLVGELQHWPSVLFSRAAGGGGAIVGISWLPLIFGPYFAVKLARAGDRPSSAGKAIIFALLGILVMGLGVFLAAGPAPNFAGKVILGLVLVAAGGGLQFSGWSCLAKTLIAYAYAARIPVAIIMYFALSGNWGTHYDALPPNYTGPTNLIPKYVTVALLPQMLGWISFTLIVGGLCGAIAAAIVKGGRPVPRTTA